MSEIYKDFTTDELLAIQRGDFSNIPTEKLIALQQAMPAQTVQAPKAPAEPQRLRSFLQGATFGFADEAEAAVRGAVTRRPSEPIRQDIMRQVEAYRQDSPLGSLGIEAAGAFVPALAAAPFTGGTSMTATLPSVGRVAALSATQGGLTGFGTGEGGFLNRLRKGAEGATVGAIVGPTGEAVIRTAGVPLNALLDVARRRFGGRGAKAVETEVQRLVKESGLTPDEIIERIARGEIMAENQTLQQSVRTLYTGGGEASSQIKSTLGPRPEALRRQAQEQLQQGLAPGTSGNVLQQTRLNEDQLRIAERAMYNQAFEKGGVVTEPLLQKFTTAMQRSPTAAKDVGDYYRAQSGKSPFFSVSPDGNVEFSRTPNLQDMEIVRRGLQEQVDVAYRGGRGATGEALKDLERDLRSAIDTAGPAVGQARATAAQTRSNRDAFEQGRKVLGQSADQVDILMSEFLPEQIASFRAGAMDAIRNRMTTGARKSMMGNLADESSKEGRILRSIFPQDQLDDMITNIGVAAQSQQASNRILGGSDSASSLLQSRRIGMNISPQDVSEALTTSNPFAFLRIGAKLVGQNTQGLSDAQRLQVARILTSTDPDLVRRALTDESAMIVLQQQIRTLGNQVATGARGATSGIAGSRLGTTQQGQ